MLGSFFGNSNRAAVPLPTSGFRGAVSCVTLRQNTATYADIHGRMNAFDQLSAFAVFAGVCCVAKPVRVVPIAMPKRKLTHSPAVSVA
jgi:hypothetical protein